MLTQIEATGSPLVPLSIASPAQIARPEPVIGADRLKDAIDFLPASLTQKASVAKVSIDPSVEEPRKLLKPFGIEMWEGAPKPEPKAETVPDPKAEVSAALISMKDDDRPNPSTGSDWAEAVDRFADPDEPTIGRSETD